jgi:hypothetical protein
MAKFLTITYGCYDSANLLVEETVIGPRQLQGEPSHVKTRLIYKDGDPAVGVEVTTTVDGRVGDWPTRVDFHERFNMPPPRAKGTVRLISGETGPAPVPRPPEKPGQRRLYASAAARTQAYRERKKARLDTPTAVAPVPDADEEVVDADIVPPPEPLHEEDTIEVGPPRQLKRRASHELLPAAPAKRPRPEAERKHNIPLLCRAPEGTQCSKLARNGQSQCSKPAVCGNEHARGAWHCEEHCCKHCDEHRIVWRETGLCRICKTL